MTRLLLDEMYPPSLAENMLAQSPHAGLVLVRGRRWPRTSAGLSRLETAPVALLSREAAVTADAVKWL